MNEQNDTPQEWTSVYQPIDALAYDYREQLATSGKGNGIIDEVVDRLLTREIDRRADLLVQGYDKLEELRKGLAKVKPDNVQFDIDGNEVSRTFSNQKNEERKKSDKAIGKISGAINKAIESADYSDLEKQLSGKGDDDKKDEERA